MTTQKIAIVTDSTAYIPASALKGLDITVIPVWLLWDGERYRDNVDIDSPTFYNRLKTSKTLPTSSQPTPGEFVTLFEQLSETHDHIIAILVSEKLSGTFNSATLAKQELPDLDIHVIDTCSASMASGIPVLAAARAAARGESVEDVVAAAETTCKKTFIMFVVDTLEYLHRGGRIGGAKRYLGSALKIKPLLHISGGTIEPIASIRTKAKAIQHLLDLVEEQIKGLRIVEAAVVDIAVPDEGDALAEMVKKRFNIGLMHRAGVSPVVGTHVGPGALGLAFSIE